MKLRANDNVLVIKGKDRGKTGKIQKVLSKDDKVLVEGINVVFKHLKAAPGLRQAGIIQKELPIQVANVVLVCPQCNHPTKIKARILPDGTKARICSKCKEVIE